ncbi:histidinol dehydrogenase [Luminiphilus syltensis NOR5-1B]|uniref:Histidinol dehydrogenase n=1 Tax=Luminiphilus syltensis NOR5-1B TaxID=565045 RepID=B8KR76_9GAMM|nr:histidinol dehydrogenase [Luminiphilus syltensis]EED35164.1 histidinol dehydrogenase [Luminiphilus syltensis NOR5-1B]
MSGLINRLKADDAQFEAQFQALTSHADERDPTLVGVVADIISEVRSRGDAALVEYTRKFDRRAVERMDDLVLDGAALQAALARIDPIDRDALEMAAERIRDYHQHQLSASWSFTDDYGNQLGQRVTPLARAGVYVPGGKASYPSSVLMNVIPATVAGVHEIALVVPAPEGNLNDLVLAAAAIAGVSRVVTIGGAQAIAAMAYGTETVPRVDKIVGPGNRFVAEAKRQVFGAVGIDMVAGPSEILIIADGSVDPAWMAMDLFSQAEHDEQAQAILLGTDAAYLDAVEAAIAAALPDMERADIIRESLGNRGALIQVADIDAAIMLSNRIGPEHLELATRDAEQLVDRIDVAGAIFVGPMTSEALGDYCAGPNHVLPTSNTARFSSPLGVYDFQKRSSVIHCSEQGSAALGKVASVLARGESLTAHARSAELRGE